MGRLKKLCPILIPVLASIIIIVLFQSVFLLGYVPTASMEPTLKTGSLLLGLRLFDELETGDIIIFHHDGSCLVRRRHSYSQGYRSNCPRKLLLCARRQYGELS